MEEVNVLMLLFLTFQAVFILLNTSTWESFKTAVMSSASLFAYFIGLYFFTFFMFARPVNFFIHYHVELVLLFATLFYFVFTRQERTNEDVITDAVNIYK